MCVLREKTRDETKAYLGTSEYDSVVRGNCHEIGREYRVKNRGKDRQLGGSEPEDGDILNVAPEYETDVICEYQQEKEWGMLILL